MALRRLLLILLILLGATTTVAARSPAAQALAQRAEAEYPGRLLVLASPAEGAARGLPEDAREQLRQAERGLFRRVSLRGIVTPFRQHWFDRVRCAIYVPAGEEADAELWTLAHEIGHCVARLEGWQKSLWTDPDLVARHRSESWADAFAAMLMPAAERARLAAYALRRRAVAGSDAAYLTDRAIRCGLQAPAAPAATLRELAQQVDVLLQPACLSGADSLRAAQGFLSSVK